VERLKISKIEVLKDRKTEILEYGKMKRLKNRKAER
jgi:hypothetical protein